MGNSQIASVEEEFHRLGLWKLSEAVRKEAALIITGSPNLSQPPGVNGEVGDLINLYRETKLDEFLQDGFVKLSPDKKLAWLREIVAKPEMGYKSSDFGASISGRGGFAVTALLKAYEDPDPGVNGYAKSMLEAIFLDGKSGLVNTRNVETCIKELCKIIDLPQPYAVTREKLKGTDTTLQGFLFNWGGNIYVLSYRKNGGTVHTVIDTGERRYKPNILKLLRDNGIEPANIERILLTHHHFDHSGLVDVLCMVSGARLMVHPAFKGESIELPVEKFGKYLEWLPAARADRTRNIGGMSFSILGEPLDIGEGARLEVLGLPEGDSITHTVDQLLFFYTPKNSPETLEKLGAGFRPTDEVLFSGDLWLMHPPGFFEDTMRGLIIADVIKERRRKFDFRPQNRREKDALKIGYDIITVKPGHGPEFLGTRVLGTFLSRRDLIVKLGFDENGRKDVLNDRKYAERIVQLKDAAYGNFIEELRLWLNPIEKAGFGYAPEDVAGFLLRIYKEQSGGGELVGQDRKERRIDLKNKLSQIKADAAEPPELQKTASLALILIEQFDPGK